jgi:hypothetical protein
MLGEAIGSALVEAGSAAGPLGADVRGSLIGLRPVKPPFIELGKKP